MVKIIIKIMLAILVTSFLEDFVVSAADNKIRKNDFYFEKNFKFDDLDWYGPEKQLCRYEYVLLIYGYQTCFVKSYKSKKISEGSYDFVYDESGRKVPAAFMYIYTSPVKKLSISFDLMSTNGKESFRFRAPVWSAVPYKIYENGEVVKK